MTWTAFAIFAKLFIKNKSSLSELALRLEILHCPLLQSVYQRSWLQKIPVKNHKGEHFQKHISVWSMITSAKYTKSRGPKPLHVGGVSPSSSIYARGDITVLIQGDHLQLPFSLDPSYRMGRVYKWKWSGYVCMCVITSKMIIISARRLHRPL